MSEKLCLSCRTEGLTRCPIKELMRNLQRRVPKVVASGSDLDKLGEITQREKEIHELARTRGCGFHNDLTLRLPRFNFE